MPFLIIFILIPFIEIMVFMQVGDAIGIGTTLLLALLTAILGGFIIKYQGVFTIHAVRESIAQGKTPVAEIFDGFCLVAAGATLITPGFVTDTVGFLLLIPPVRTALRKALSSKMNVASSKQFHQNPNDPYQSRQDSNVIEGDYERVEDDKKS